MVKSLVADRRAAGGDVLPAANSYVCADGEEAGEMEEGNQEIVDSLLIIV